MDFRLRPDPCFQSGQRISVVCYGNEITEWSLQEAWEYEYKISERLREAQKAYPLEDDDIHTFASPLPTEDDDGDGNEVINSWGSTRCFLSRPSGMLHPLHSVSVEFVEEYYGYRLEVWGGVGRWTFEPIKYPSYIDRIGQTKQEKPGSLQHSWCYYSHDFFASRVVVTKSDIFDGFEKLTSYCNQIVQEVKNGCYCTFKIYLQSSLNAPRKGEKYVEFYVSGNTKLMTVFETLCGHKLRDTFTLTQFVQFGPERGRGKTHSWHDSKESRVKVKDLEWIIEDGAVWLLPMPYRITAKN